MANVFYRQNRLDVAFSLYNQVFLPTSFMQVLTTCGKFVSVCVVTLMLDHGGNRTYDLWNASPMHALPTELRGKVGSSTRYRYFGTESSSFDDPT